MAALLFRQLSARGCGPRLCTTTAGAQARHLLCSTPTRRQLSTVVSTAGASATTATAVASRSAAASTETGILAYMRSNPYKANVIIATFKTALCDVLVQRYIEGKEQIDWKRNAVFWCFGLGYLGMFQWYIYVTCFKRWFPGMALFASQSLGDKLRNASGMRELLKQVAFDNFVHYPFIYFPFFYVFKETIQGTGYESPLAIPAYGLAKYQTNCVEDNLLPAWDSIGQDVGAVDPRRPHRVRGAAVDAAATKPRPLIHLDLLPLLLARQQDRRRRGGGGPDRQESGRRQAAVDGDGRAAAARGWVRADRAEK